MKRLALIISGIIIIGILLAALNSTHSLNISEDNITAIVIDTLPKREEYSRVYRDTEKIKKVTGYLNGLSLKRKFFENPYEYNGMTYIINISYADGSQNLVYHFGNMFIRKNEGKWKRMAYNEAEKLDKLIQDNPSD